MTGWVVAGAVSVAAVMFGISCRGKVHRLRDEVRRQMRFRAEVEDRAMRDRMVLRGVGLFAASELEHMADAEEDRQMMDERARYIASRLRAAALAGGSDD
jgi:hypothetical protein